MIRVNCLPALIALLAAWLCANIIQTKTTTSSDSLLWPNKQLNVLVDDKSLNETEQQIIESLLQQLEHKTCLRVQRLDSQRVNPFDTSGRQLDEKEKNFVYIFKSHVGLYNRPPTIGLSTFGCSRKGRQSLVLTDASLRWPELVLRYHLLRSLGVRDLARPSESELAELESQHLPLSQKINTSGSLRSPLEELPFAFATGPIEDEKKYLSEADLTAVKQLYDCPEYQNRLGVRPIPSTTTTTTEQPSSRPLLASDTTTGEKSGSQLSAKKLKSAEDSLRQIISSVAQERGARLDDQLVENAAKSIVHYLLAELEGEPVNPRLNPAISNDGKQLENLLDSLKCTNGSACPNSHGQQQPRSHQELSTDAELQARPMLLKLDPFHANDPQLRQANQMKLSQLNSATNVTDFLAPQQTYRLLNNQLDPFNSNQQQQQQQQQPKQTNSNGKTEMMISFEQMPDNSKNPIDALASSQVLKLCSCTCQTMTPTSPAPSTPTVQPTFRPPTTDYPPATDYPTYPTFQPTLPPITLPPLTDDIPKTHPPTFPPPTNPMTQPPWTVTDYPSIPTATPTWPPFDPSQLTDEPDPWTPWTQPAQPNNTKPTSKPTSKPTTSPDTYPPDTFTYAPVTTPPPPPPKPTPTTSERPTSATTTTTEPQQGNNNGTDGDWPPAAVGSSCDQVQWVKPNKTIYSSAKIVWDVDRANQNYFLCNTQLESGELVPGKTHGLSCKVSSEGKAYEMHQFRVLIKPESVNLAWISKDSKSFGTKNLPVIGGHSAAASKPSSNNLDAGDPYVVSRCLIRDENNDVITLIGYINKQNIGWFPYDDIQIECSQYDVLACVN